MKNFEQELSIIPDPVVNSIVSVLNAFLQADTDGDPVFSGYTGKTYFALSVNNIDGGSTITVTFQESDDTAQWDDVETFADLATDYTTNFVVNLTKPYVRVTVAFAGASEAPTASVAAVGFF